MGKQMEMFKHNLEDFASKHREDIRKDPEFRLQFQEMCASIGVDPLASSKGFWAEMLGVGDFYYELGIQIVEVCMATSKRNGGLIGIEELRRKVEASRGRNSQAISIDDLLRSIKKLKILGNGFCVHRVGESYLVQSIPGELTLDHTIVLQHAQENGHVTQSGLIKSLQWEKERAKRALDFMVTEGLAWVDDQSGSERSFWFPSLIPDFSTSVS
ncbi:vacuolar-sorting protein SNF8-like isoform X2 [Physella acuta]|nr:vacuolar-sorting protein SNF8-like isoform X2 [Physella acuta]